MARAWFAYTNTGSDPLLASSYRLATTTIPACRNGVEVCAIYVYVLPGIPNPVGSSPLSPLSPNIQEYITNGLVTFSAQPDFDGGAYVYLKNAIA